MLILSYIIVHLVNFKDIQYHCMAVYKVDRIFFDAISIDILYFKHDVYLHAGDLATFIVKGNIILYMKSAQFWGLYQFWV